MLGLMTDADTSISSTVPSGPAFLDSIVERFMTEIPATDGLYLAPDGETHVEVRRSADLEYDTVGEVWKILGRQGVFTRRQVAEACHGPYSWQRMHTAAEFADETRVSAAALGMSIEDVVHHVDANGSFPER